jgi:phage tail sheath protein FI
VLCIVDQGRSILGTMTEAPSSVFAGIQAGVDNDQGFWVSVSNKPINGIIGTSRAIDFAMGDTTSEANLLNAGNVATIINEDGYRTWGSRTLSSDSRYAFANVARIADILAQTVQDNHLWAVDKNITRGYLAAVSDGVNAYMRTLISLGALTGTQNVGSLINCCVPNAELNTPANIAACKVYFDFYFTPSFIAEQITFRQVFSTDGLAELSA